MSEMRPKAPSALVIAGPTASGKSALALRLAEEAEGVLINADSMQVYRELRVLTARPSDSDLRRAPHRLFGVLPGDQPCSAGRWRKMAVEEIGAALARGKLPIVVGGTGLYLKALMEGLAHVPSVPAKAREEASALYERLGGEAFRKALESRDPESAAQLHPNDRQRLIRAWEVVQATGRPLPTWQREAAEQDSAPCGFRTLTILPDRALLYRCCDTRFSTMIEAGALDEVEALMNLGYARHLPVMKSLGVPELSACLRGEVSLADAVKVAQMKTRRYAKRQLTWLRHQLPSNDRNAFTTFMKHSESLDAESFNKIRQKVLTLRP
jgi:tRNA dimethylallyltransferase